MIQISTPKTRRRWHWWYVPVGFACAAATYAILSILAFLACWPYFPPAMVLGYSYQEAAGPPPREEVVGQFAGWWPDGFKDLLTLNPDGTLFQDVKKDGVWSTNTGTWTYDPVDGRLHLEGLDDSHAYDYSQDGSVTGTIYRLVPLGRLWLDTGEETDYFGTTVSGLTGRMMWPVTLPIALFYAKTPDGAPHQR